MVYLMLVQIISKPNSLSHFHISITIFQNNLAPFVSMLTLQHFNCLFNIVLNIVLNIGENDKYFISGLFFLSDIYRICYLSL